MDVPETACVLHLYKHVKDRLIACEPVMFAGGAFAIKVTLRRAAISGHVEVGGKIENYFADLKDEHGSMVENVALDAGSYRALKTRWARTRLDKEAKV